MDKSQVYHSDYIGSFHISIKLDDFLGKFNEHCNSVFL